jgi:hypothetical protein
LLGKDAYVRPAIEHYIARLHAARPRAIDIAILLGKIVKYRN